MVVWDPLTGADEMARRGINPRLVKIHRTYSVDEISRRFKVHKQTVRNWIKAGLATVDRQRPILIHGKDLIAFLQTRRAKAKQTCPPGTIYCMRCRLPRAPAGGIADFVPVTSTSGNLIGICCTCDAMMYRRVRRERLDHVRGTLEVTITQPRLRIADRASPSVNYHLNEDRTT